METSNPAGQKPQWLRKKVSLNNENIAAVKDLLVDLNLNTVCQSAKCPNIFECFSKKTATFMLLGDKCTRNCAFCGVDSLKPLPPDKNEPANIAKAVKELSLQYIVLTSVTRDDIEDGGALQFAETVKKIKKEMPGAVVECLVPDFRGTTDNLKVLLDANPDVVNHNAETVKSNYKKIRSGASYKRSLGLLKSSKKLRPDIITKSGFMLGLGESIKEIKELLSDLSASKVDIVTIGQYLRPSVKNYPVIKYYNPDEFSQVEEIAKGFAFKYVVSGTFVRSSYQASAAYKAITEGNIK